MIALAPMAAALGEDVVADGQAGIDPDLGRLRVRQPAPAGGRAQ